MIDLYNRYIPQPDGSYHKNRTPEPMPPTKPPNQGSLPKPEPPVCTAAPPCPEPPARHPPRPEPAPGFLRQLLPKNLDTGDLVIILLLLLMAGDREDAKANALLTLALYFLM